MLGATEPLGHALVGAAESLANWWLDRPGEPVETVALRLMNFAWMGFGNLVRGDVWHPRDATRPGARPAGVERPGDSLVFEGRRPDIAYADGALGCRLHKGARVRRALGSTTRGSEVGIRDKVTGRTKQAAGDLAGNTGLKRRGRQEEKKGEAKDDLKREDREAAREEAKAKRERDKAESRAQSAAARERAKAEPAQQKARQSRSRAGQKAGEVENLERKTGGSTTRAAQRSGSGAPTKSELYAEAQRLDVEGRSDMNKAELEKAIAKAKR